LTSTAAIAPPACSLWIAIVQNADSSFLFDDLDAAPQSGSSINRAAMLRQVIDLPSSEAEAWIA
jgi:hypothetical protein